MAKDIPEGLARKIDDDEASEIFSASRVAFVITDPNQDDNPVIYVNKAFERLTGYSSEIAVGRNCRFLQCEDTKPESIKKIRDALASNAEIAITVANQRSDGEVFHNALVITPVYADLDDQTGVPQYFLGMQRRISGEDEESQLALFETAITEIQHRVKNHLSMILGLIRLKSRELSDADELGDISRRIESIQLLYEEMAAARRHSNEDKIQLGAYLGRVAAAIAHLDGRPGVRMNVDVASLEVQTDRAARIGLIVSEILTNCMQHAFDGQETGLVELRVVVTDAGGLRASISDDGVGLPENVDWPNSGGLGSRVVMGLIRGLQGSIEISRGRVGTVVIFEIPNAMHGETG